MNTPVSYAIAKLLKEKGFDLPAQKYYEHALKSVKNKEDGYSGPFGWKKGELNLQTDYFVNNSKTADLTSEMWYMCSAPTIADVVMWLLMKHKIWIWVGCRDLENGKTIFIANGRNIPSTKSNEFVVDVILYQPKDNPSEAYEAAIEYALNKLI